MFTSELIVDGNDDRRVTYPCSSVGRSGSILFIRSSTALVANPSLSDVAGSAMLNVAPKTTRQSGAEQRQVASRRDERKFASQCCGVAMREGPTGNCERRGKETCAHAAAGFALRTCTMFAYSGRRATKALSAKSCSTLLAFVARSPPRMPLNASNCVRLR